MQYAPSSSQSAQLKHYEKQRLGVFVHFNMQQFTYTDNEFALEKSPSFFNPNQLCVEQWFENWSKAGIRYAVLTARHTSEFCLWDTKATPCNSMNSPVHTDVVAQFVSCARKYGIEPCLYYCLWGGEFNPDPNAREIILMQLDELATRYGDLMLFWLDMGCWLPKNLSIRELYDFLKVRQPNALVHFNQHIQDGSQIHYFPTDVLNGEERMPPECGHQKLRMVDGKEYYLPFEAEFCLQCLDEDVGFGLWRGSRWFTYSKQTIDGKQSRPVSLDILYPYIRQAYQRGASNVLISTAPDCTGRVRTEDIAALQEIHKRLIRDGLI